LNLRRKKKKKTSNSKKNKKSLSLFPKGHHYIFS
jgi:hypothetical protein